MRNCGAQACATDCNQILGRQEGLNNSFFRRAFPKKRTYDVLELRISILLWFGLGTRDPVWPYQPSITSIALEAFFS